MEQKLTIKILTTLRDDCIHQKKVTETMGYYRWYDKQHKMLEDAIGALNEAIKALEQSEQKKEKWIPIKTRPMDEDERKEWSEKLGYDVEYEDAVIYLQLPDDGQEVLTCNRYGHIRIDKFENDPDYGCCFEENGDMDGIVAWMPLPKPWEGEE